MRRKSTTLINLGHEVSTFYNWSLKLENDSPTVMFCSPNIHEIFHVNNSILYFFITWFKHSKYIDTQSLLILVNVIIKKQLLSGLYSLSYDIQNIGLFVRLNSYPNVLNVHLQTHPHPFSSLHLYRILLLLEYVLKRVMS